MKVAMFFLIFLGLMMGAKAQNMVSVTGFEGEQIRGIKVSGMFEIKISQGEHTGAKLQIPEHFQQNLVFKLGGDGVLEIALTGKVNGHRNDNRFTAEIVCSSLEQIDLSGACRLQGEGDFNADKLSVDLSGAVEVYMKGTILADREVGIDMSGASKFNGGIQTLDLEIEMSGATQLTLRGKAAKAEMEMSGASRGDMEGCPVETLSVSTSGASQAKVNAVEQLNISGYGASKINYRGNPRMNVNTSGASSVTQI